MFFVKQVTEALTASSPTVLYFHGNAGNIGHRLMNVKGFVQMLGCNVCLLEYRGYGHSDGSPSEDGLYMDAQAALDYLVGRPDVDQRKIIVFGRSLGKCIITYVHDVVKFPISYFPKSSAKLNSCSWVSHIFYQFFGCFRSQSILESKF